MSVWDMISIDSPTWKATRALQYNPTPPKGPPFQKADQLSDTVDKPISIPYLLLP